MPCSLENAAKIHTDDAGAVFLKNAARMHGFYVDTGRQQNCRWRDKRSPEQSHHQTFTHKPLLSILDRN
jgi:hypothetical protein